MPGPRLRIQTLLRHAAHPAQGPCPGLYVSLTSEMDTGCACAASRAVAQSGGTVDRGKLVGLQTPGLEVYAAGSPAAYGLWPLAPLFLRLHAYPARRGEMTPRLPLVGGRGRHRARLDPSSRLEPTSATRCQAIDRSTSEES